MTSALTVGDVQVTAVLDWAGTAGNATNLLPEAPLSLWEDNRGWLVPRFWQPETGRRALSVHSWLLRTDSLTVLIDTGAGAGKERPGSPLFHQLSSDYLARLAQAGVEPADVDLVINTHLHADHVGWNTRLADGQWLPTFPNASYLMARRDVEFWDPTGTARPRLEAANANVFDDSIRPVLDAGQAVLWDEAYAVARNLRLELAPGHTPGSAVAHLGAGREQVVFVGDVLHSPLQVLAPDCASCFCEDPTAAAASRRRVLSWAADCGALVAPAHLVGASAMTVRSDGHGFDIDGWHSFLADPSEESTLNSPVDAVAREVDLDGR